MTQVLGEWTPAARFLLAVAVILAATHLAGALLRRFGQPAVVGEILAGILLGPSLLGAMRPDISHWLFASDVLSALDMVAQFGLVAFMFLLGSELRFERLRGLGRTVATVGVASLAVPFLCVLPVAFLLYREHGRGTSAAGFSLFVGLAVAITALPVLARILEDKKLIRTPVGAVALAAAVLGDVAAWAALAFVLAVTSRASGAGAVLTLALSGAIIVLMATVVRRAMGWLVHRCETGALAESALLPIVLIGGSLSAVATQLVGIHAVFGGFLFGAIMPRGHPVVERVGERIRALVVTVLLPLFFAYVGLHTAFGAIGASAGGWFACLGIVALAFATKLLGVTAAARASGLPRSESLTLGVLMNCRGLTELVIANIGLQLHIVDTYLFTVLVIVALLTTLFTAPMLRAVGWLTRRHPTPATDAPDPSTERPAQAVDLNRLRAVLGQFATGVAVVTTTTADGLPVGMTVNSFSSVSLDPPLVLFCVNRSSVLHPVFTQAQEFVVNVLSSGQRDLSRSFARPGLDRFGNGIPRPAQGGGAPVLDNALANIECVLERVVVAGDHDIVIGRVCATDAPARIPDPLIFYGGTYRLLDAENIDCWVALA
ncbi:MAG: hypothetical protein JWR37_6060 [Mycobacterium sp.]|jgi:Kef-type K+ transport system membrane component KefB/flavin reductase (DIM6/NTAB) family NADH-FMN oxidoreductase RutF|nr:hypothetical protein [Mycobacterium sp.]